ncbi:MAG: type II toxin-antitoxin system Phd/YefM family antitoxin [Acidimicrobiia bacterium]|nr:type II toxin-antitoxin system Phd/YefM family antitoxin [Acidimicrobiia bacterium]MDH5521806.1 type II toxin-antitoxin system Phd/YefM family antitoxin [Acidimicrobiia bacterium]
MPDVSATDAARKFSDLLDAVEHRGERFTVIRRGKVVARIEPVEVHTGAVAKDLLKRHTVDGGWAGDLAELRDLLELQERP